MTRLRRYFPQLLVGIGLLVYANSFHGPFLFDDQLAIQENSHLHHLWPIRNVLTAPANTPTAQRPVVSLSLAVNYAISGLEVWSYHLVNISLHLLSALLLYGIVRRTFLGARFFGQWRRDAAELALAVSLLWVVHPLQTEAVNYVVQRTELMMGFFLLLTLYASLRGFDSSLPWRWYGLAIVACLLGMGSKEVMVSAPWLVLLYDWIFISSTGSEIWRNRKWFYCGLAATWILLGSLVILINAPGNSAGFGQTQISWWLYLKTQAGVICYYLRLSGWPGGLSLDHEDWPMAHHLGEVLPQALLLVLLMTATAIGIWKRTRIGYLGGWFFMILAPTSSFLPIVTEVVAERRMYLPLAALITLIVVGCVWSFRERSKRLPGFLLVLAVVILGTLTVRRNILYQERTTIWADALAQHPRSAQAQTNYGLALEEAGQVELAIPHYQAALEINPNRYETHFNLANSWVKLGHWEAATREFEAALRLNPRNSKVQFNWGLLLVKLGKQTEAAEQFKAALQSNPELELAHNSLGLLLVEQGNLEQAIEHYRAAIQINPQYSNAHNNLGIALARQNKLEAARESYEKAVAWKPDNAAAYNNLGVTLLRLGLKEESISAFQQAVRIDPQNLQYQKNLTQAVQLKQPQPNTGSPPP